MILVSLMSSTALASRFTMGVLADTTLALSPDVLAACSQQKVNVLADLSSPAATRWMNDPNHLMFTWTHAGPVQNIRASHQIVTDGLVDALNRKMSQIGPITGPIRFRAEYPATANGATLLRTNQNLWPDRCNWENDTSSDQRVVFHDVIERCRKPTLLDGGVLDTPRRQDVLFSVTIPANTTRTMTEMLQALSEQDSAVWAYTCSVSAKLNRCMLRVASYEAQQELGEFVLEVSRQAVGPTGCLFGPR